MRLLTVFVAVVLSLVLRLTFADDIPVAFVDKASIEKYFPNAKVEELKHGRKLIFGKKYPRLIRVTEGGKQWVFIDPKKSGYAKDWAEALGKDKVPKGYDIDHVYAKSRAKNRFGFVRLEPVKSEVNQAAGRVFEKRFARMSKADLAQYKQHLDSDIAQGYRPAGPMEKLKLSAVHGVDESKIRVPTGIGSDLSLKEFQERAKANRAAKVKKILSGASGVSVAMLGVTLTDALQGFYKSPIVRLTQGKLRERQYASARRFFEEQCLNAQTAKPECMKLRQAVSDASTILRARIWTDFPDFGRKLFESWEAEARALHQAEDAFNKALGATTSAKPAPPDPIAFTKLPGDAYLSFRVLQELPRRALGRDSVQMKGVLIALVDEHWVRVSGARIGARLNDTLLNRVETGPKGEFAVTLSVPDDVANHELRLNVGRMLERKYFISSYDYVVEADGQFPVGQSDGRDAVELSFNLQRRMVDVAGNTFTTEPGDYSVDFDSIAFQGRKTDVKVSSGGGFDIVTKLKPPPDSGHMKVSMTASDPGRRFIVADLRGGKFQSRLVEVGKFEVTFIETVPGLELQWADSMTRWMSNGKVVLPDQPEGAPNKLELAVVAVRNTTGSKVPVKGIPIRFTLRPAEHVRLGNSLPETGTDGVARMVGKLPYIWGPKIGRGTIVVSAPGSSNTLEAVISGVPQNLLLPNGWVHGVLYNSNDGECAHSGKPLVFRAWHSTFTTIPDLQILTNVIVTPGQRMSIALPRSRGAIRAFIAASATDPNSAVGGSIAFVSLNNLDNGWWFAAGCKDGTRPEKPCDNGRGGGARCKEL